jgi:hypothetical protein
MKQSAARTRDASLVVVMMAVMTATAGCGPSIDAAVKSDVDRRVAMLQPSARSYGVPASADPMPLAVGQWVTYKFVDDKGQPSFMTFKLVGQDGQAFWYETLAESYYGKTATRMLVDFGDRKNPQTIVIKAAKLREAKGNIIEYPPAMVQMMNSVLRGQLGPIVIDWHGLPQDAADAVTPAGRFPSCYKGKSTVSFAGFKSEGTGWGHPVVPFSGMVRMQSDNNTSGELIDFGTSGAKSDF